MVHARTIIIEYKNTSCTNKLWQYAKLICTACVFISHPTHSSITTNALSIFTHHLLFCLQSFSITYLSFTNCPHHHLCRQSHHQTHHRCSSHNHRDRNRDIHYHHHSNYHRNHHPCHRKQCHQHSLSNAEHPGASLMCQRKEIEKQMTVKMIKDEDGNYVPEECCSFSRNFETGNIEIDDVNKVLATAFMCICTFLMRCKYIKIIAVSKETHHVFYITFKYCPTYTSLY